MNGDIGHLCADIPILAFSWCSCDKKSKEERNLLLLLKFHLRDSAWKFDTPNYQPLKAQCSKPDHLFTVVQDIFFKL